MGPTAGTISRTARAAAARWGLKEAAGKTLARRTAIAYEAGISVKVSVYCPGRSVYLPSATDCNIYVWSKRAGERILASVIQFLANQQLMAVAHGGIPGPVICMYVIQKATLINLVLCHC